MWSTVSSLSGRVQLLVCVGGDSSGKQLGDREPGFPIGEPDQLVGCWHIGLISLVGQRSSPLGNQLEQERPPLGAGPVVIAR